MGKYVLDMDKISSKLGKVLGVRVGSKWWPVEDHHEATQRPSEGNLVPGDGQDKAGTIVITFTAAGLYTMSCAKCGEDISSISSLLHHQCPDNTVQSEAGQ